MPEWMEPYRGLICNTGGNPVEELVNDAHTNARNNLVRAALCVAVTSQVHLLTALHQAGALAEPDQPEPTFKCVACGMEERAGLRLTYSGAPMVCENCAAMWPTCENCTPAMRNEPFHRLAIWRIAGPQVPEADRPELWCGQCKHEGMDDPRSMANELGITAESLL